MREITKTIDDSKVTIRRNEPEREEIEKIGLDKIILSNIIIEDIDIEKLKKQNGITIKYVKNDNQPYITFDPERNQGINHITIDDNDYNGCEKRFERLVIGYQVKKDIGQIQYAHLTLTVSALKGTNDVSMSHDEYTSYLPDIQEYLKDIYGIEINYDNVKVKTMEINLNLIMERPISEYSRIIDLLMAHCDMPNADLLLWGGITPEDRKKGKSKNNKQISISSSLLKNSSNAFTIYDKGKQLNDTGRDSTDRNILRLEWRLLNSKKITEVFHTTLWDEIHDDMITSAFSDFLNRHIIDHYNQWLTNTHNELKKMLLSFKNNPECKKWIDLTLENIRNIEQGTKIPYILDLKQLTDVVAEIEPTSWYKYGVPKVLLKKQRFLPSNVYLNHDLCTADDIIRRIQEIEKKQ